MGQATIKEISKTAKVARQDNYRILVELQKHSLVEKVIAAPTKYKAIPLKDGISVLRERMNKERDEANRKIAEMLRRYKHENVDASPPKEEPQFILTSGKGALMLKIKKAIMTTQSSVDIITSRKRFLQAQHPFSEDFQKNIEKNIKIRVIIEQKDAEKHRVLSNEPAKTYMKYPYFKLRYILTPHPVILLIFDRKEAFIFASPNAGLTDAPALWSDNECVVEIVQTYFESTWLKAFEPKPEQP